MGFRDKGSGVAGRALALCLGISNTRNIEVLINKIYIITSSFFINMYVFCLNFSIKYF